MYFIGDSIIFVLFENKDCRESQILYTTKFNPGIYRQLEIKTDMKHINAIKQVSMKAIIEKHHEIYPL